MDVLNLHIQQKRRKWKNAKISNNIIKSNNTIITEETEIEKPNIKISNVIKSNN